MHDPARRSLLRLSVALAALLALTSFFWAGCSRDTQTPTSVANTQTNSSVDDSPYQTPQDGDAFALSLDASNPAIQRIMDVQDRYTGNLMKSANVVGTATGVSDKGGLVIKILTVEPSLPGSLPNVLEGVPVQEEVTGVIHALQGGGGGVSHTAKQTPPIQLGTSGGWRFDLANGFCCGGTLGSLVQRGGTQYILSNYHVLYADIVSGGNGRTAQPGDPVIQPGLIDVNCTAANAQDVATLVAGGGSLPAANVDVGIASVISGMVRTDGAILEIGTISAQTIAASIGQLVKKSGRTTALSRSSVSGLNATISVQYDNECAGGVAFTKTYNGQILVSNRRSRFLAGGDSGSLMVQDVTTNPRAVGLLYAGSNTLAVANPIGSVLSWIGGGATMVGQ